MLGVWAWCSCSGVKSSALGAVLIGRKAMMAGCFRIEVNRYELCIEHKAFPLCAPSWDWNRQLGAVATKRSPRQQACVIGLIQAQEKLGDSLFTPRNYCAVFSGPSLITKVLIAHSSQHDTKHATPLSRLIPVISRQCHPSLQRPLPNSLVTLALFTPSHTVLAALRTF